MLCALAREPYQSLSIVPTKFAIPSDWISFLSVACTKDGRIFLGGQDGNLYELDYTLFMSSQYALAKENNSKAKLEKFYDGVVGESSSEPFPAVVVESQSTTKGIFSTGKRAIENMMNPSGQPSRKCRKLNHSLSFTSAYVPDFVSKVASAIFGESTTTGGGPIIQMVVDEERKVLYTLSTRGWICVLDIADPKKITLASVLNTPATAHLYLEAVSRGRMYAPASSNSRVGLLSFPGGGQGAQAGVGGMDGARKILKLAEQEKKNSRRQRNATSLLTPISIDIVPTHESTRLTLVAVSSGGLRYYLSNLTPNSLNAGPALPPFGTPRSRHPWRPHSRMTLCHVRAPPPLGSNTTSLTSSAPSIEPEYRVDASSCNGGNFFAAFQKANLNGVSSDNVLVIASADGKARISKKTKEGEQEVATNHIPGGLCENVSNPMTAISRLPGGRVWDIRASSKKSNGLVSLTLRSKTPSDSELGFGMVPAYMPPKKKPSGRSISGSRSLATNSSALMTKSTTSSFAFAVMKNLLLSRPARYGLNVKSAMVEDDKEYEEYRISVRAGASTFSHSAADYKSKTSTSITRSARLSPWLLTPDANPVNPMALQHIDQIASPYLALNAGGLHVFEAPSILKQLASAILAARDNVSSDPAVLDFFQKFGYSEGCAMCLFLAAKPSSGAELKQLAKSAALRLGYTPTLVAKSSSEEHVSQDPWIPKEYSFTPSALYDGLTLTVARLLRPVWFKPAVVVTEGRVLKKGLKSRTTSAKVELLLDDKTVEEIRDPLMEIQRLMETVFAPAIGAVPLSKQASGGGDEMDIDEENYLTRALEYQQTSQSKANSFMMRSSEADRLARRIEERNIHSLFRMVSRSVQCLSLVSHLRRAHSMPDLPEVQWGQLHGISISKLVLSREGQERLETTLNALVTASTSISSSLTVSADAQNLANILSEQCYHFFSKGSQHAYFGFHNAKLALGTPIDHLSRRKEYATRAVVEFKAAVSSWTSPSLITGRVLQTADSESVFKIVERALSFDSPLAKACQLLVDLEAVEPLIDLCLATASNFDHKSAGVLSKRDTATSMNLKYRWEAGLYHTRQEASHDDSSAQAIGANVTAQDAINSCYAIVFYHLSRCLQQPYGSRSFMLGEKMVSVCASYPEKSAFQHKLFKHLLDEKLTDILLRVKMDSPILEKWLEDKFDLLLKYYQIHENYVKCGDAAFSRATDVGIELTLDDRIECLVNAVDAYSTAYRKQTNMDQVEQKLRQSNEWLQVARVQAQVLVAMNGTKYETTPEEMKALETTLLTANDLINQYAIPRDLFEHCIVLLHICDFKDETQIEQFWKSLFCEEVFPCKTRDANVYRALRAFAEGSFVDRPSVELLDGGSSDAAGLFEDGKWMEDLGRTIIGLGKEILPPDAQRGTEEPATFPLGLVLSYLEGEHRMSTTDVNEDLVFLTNLHRTPGFISSCV